MNPWDLFNPASYNPLDPAMLTGQADPFRLLDAAAVFPGGATVLVFALFWAPVGPGIPAGVLLARHAGINPAITMGLYTASDVLGALICHPLFAVLRRLAGRIPALAWLGDRFMRLALLGTRLPRMEDLRSSRRAAPVLFRIGTVAFGIDVYTAGMMVAGLPVSRLAGWAAAIAGDLVWFALLLGTSMAAPAVVNDDRVVGIVVLIAMIVLPGIARRIFPALRDTEPATIPATTMAAETSLPAQQVSDAPVVPEPEPQPAPLLNTAPRQAPSPGRTAHTGGPRKRRRHR